MQTRTLSPAEIELLQARGCSAENWAGIAVPTDFNPGEAFHHVSFAGTVQLGSGGAGGGVNFSRLKNVKLGQACRVENANLEEVDVGDRVWIEQVGCLGRRERLPFGNGTPVNVLAEDGARAIPLGRELTGQIAHLACHQKNHPVGDALRDLILHDAATLALPRSQIGDGCRLRRVGELDSVWLGPGVQVEGAAVLQNCYLEGGAVPARVGSGVNAQNCVFQAGSFTGGGVHLLDCLVGEGVVLDHNFYASSSLFFANSNMALGEAVGALVGPYTVSHHRASLVLTCQCSFNTFGSASNASNHHFKLGPRHGGILRRGTRCGSGSYLFWPTDIGAFSTVVGRHTGHLDTSIFPFSLLLEGRDYGASVLIPGANLFSIGLFRDERKWRRRDARQGLERPRDLVNCAVLSPYVMQAIDKGISLLRRSEIAQGDFRHGGAVIPERRIQKALAIYEAAVIFYVGECLLRTVWAESDGQGSVDAFLRTVERLTASEVDVSGGVWRDWGGMLLSGFDAEEFQEELTQGRYASVEELRRRLEGIHTGYERRAAIWAARRWWMEHGRLEEELVGDFLERWRKAVEFRFECQERDLGKEFTREMMYGFGIEGGMSEAFRRVRGDAGDNEFMRAAQAEREELLGLAALRR